MNRDLTRLCLAWLFVLLAAGRCAAQEQVTYVQALRDMHTEIGKNYPFFELKGIDWDAVGKEFIPLAEQVQDDAAFGKLCARMVARLEDSHAHMIAGSAKLPTIDFPRWHPGFSCMEDDQGDALVYYVLPGSPADQAGIEPGMKLLKLNGKPTRDAISQVANTISQWQGYSSQQYLNYHATRWCARRIEQYDRVDMVFENTDGSERALALPAIVDGGYIPRLPVPMAGVRDDADLSYKRLDGDVGYIYVRRIKKDLNAKLDQAVGELKDVKVLILDVRGNSGGAFDGNTAFQNFEPVEAKRDPNRPVFDGPMAVLIDARCISAGEGWASWFVAKQRATFFGEPTAGASARKTVYTLTNGKFKVRYSVKGYTGFLSRMIERKGLIPDKPVQQSRADLIAGKDTVLEAAKVYLLKEYETQFK